MSDEDGCFDENGWLKPDCFAAPARVWYRERFNIGMRENQDKRSYENHYRAATRRQLRVSVLRMQWLADKIALERIRGNWK